MEFIQTRPTARTGDEDANDISADSQIVVNVGGMLRAVTRHHPINWKFHWRGIYRVICPTLWTREEKIWNRSDNAQHPYPEVLTVTKMTTMTNTPPVLGWTRFRSFPEKLTTKRQQKDHHKKLFIPLHTFEVLDFPVRMRRVECLCNEVHQGGVRFMRR